MKTPKRTTPKSPRTKTSGKGLSALQIKSHVTAGAEQARKFEDERKFKA